MKINPPKPKIGKRWQTLRKAYLKQFPLCDCGCGDPAVIVSHKFPHDGDPDLFYAWDNLVARTRTCHNAAQEK